MPGKRHDLRWPGFAFTRFRDIESGKLRLLVDMESEPRVSMYVKDYDLIEYIKSPRAVAEAFRTMVDEAVETLREAQAVRLCEKPFEVCDGELTG